MEWQGVQRRRRRRSAGGRSRRRRRNAGGSSAACAAISARPRGRRRRAEGGGVRGCDRRLYERMEELLIAADVGVDGTLKVIDELEHRCTAKKIETREPFQNELADVVAEILRPDDPELPAHRRLAPAHRDPRRRRQRHRQDDHHRQARPAPQGAGQDGAARWPATRSAPPPSSSSPTGPTASAASIVKQAAGRRPGRRGLRRVRRGRSRGTDVLLVDTAGRLHTQDNLMRELDQDPPRRRQAAPRRPARGAAGARRHHRPERPAARPRQFTEAVDVTGIVLAKLDGTAKGGIVVAIRESSASPSSSSASASSSRTSRRSTPTSSRGPSSAPPRATSPLVTWRPGVVKAAARRGRDRQSSGVIRSTVGK